MQLYVKKQKKIQAYITLDSVNNVGMCHRYLSAVSVIRGITAHLRSRVTKISKVRLGSNFVPIIF